MMKINILLLSITIFFPIKIPISSSILLSNFANTNIQFVYFTIRPVTNLFRETTPAFVNNITNLNIFNLINESLCGGPISSLMSLFVLNKTQTKSSFTADINNGLINVQRDVNSENEEMKINTHILDYNNNSNNV